MIAYIIIAEPNERAALSGFAPEAIMWNGREWHNDNYPVFVGLNTMREYRKAIKSYHGLNEFYSKPKIKGVEI